MKITIIAAIAGLALSSALYPVSASTIFQTSNAPNNGNQVFSGVGLEFTVNTPITVTGLGVFDSGQLPILTTLTVDLMPVPAGYLLTGGPGTVDASATFLGTYSSFTNGNYVFQTISPVILAAGNYYLEGYGWTSQDQERNTEVDGSPPDTFTSDPSVSFVTSVYGTGSDKPATLPSNVFGGDIFSAANLEFGSVTATPLPSTWTMLIAGFLGLGFIAYRGTKSRHAAVAAA